MRGLSRAAPGRSGPVVVNALAFPVAFLHSYPDHRTVPLAGGSCHGNSCFFFLRSIRLLENSRHAFRWSGLSPISPQTSQPSVMSLAAVASISSTQSGQASASQKSMRSSSCLRPRIQ